MGVIVEGNTPVIKRKPKAIHFYLSIEVNNGLKHETDFIMKKHQV